MDTFRSLLLAAFRDPMLERLGWALVHSIWQGALVAAILGMVLLVWRRSSASARYLAGCLAMLAMFAGLALTLLLLPGAERPRLSARPDSITLTTPASLAPPGSDGANPAAAPLMRSTSLAERAAAALPWLSIGWIAGIAVITFRHAAGWWLLRRLRATSARLEGTWKVSLARCLASIGVRRTVTLASSARVGVPTLIGYLRPLILVPPSLLAGLSVQQIEAILAHELAHVRRHDYLVNIALVVVETLLFYHPAAWWIGGVIRRERENACDDIAANAMGDRRAYARALLALEERLGVATAIALGAGGSALAPRVRRLLGVREPSRLTATGPLAAACGVVVLVTLSAVARHTLADPEGDAQQPTTTTVEGAILAEDRIAPKGPYRIGRGDLVQISFIDASGAVADAVTERVDAQGRLMVRATPVDADGRTEAELADRITTAFRGAAGDGQHSVKVVVVEAKNRSFRVTGRVGRPGEFQILRNDLHLSDALAMARVDQAAVTHATVFRKSRRSDALPARVIHVSLTDLFTGDRQFDVVLVSGDTVFVDDRFLSLKDFPRTLPPDVSAKLNPVTADAPTLAATTIPVGAIVPEDFRPLDVPYRLGPLDVVQVDVSNPAGETQTITERIDKSGKMSVGGVSVDASGKTDAELAGELTKASAARPGGEGSAAKVVVLEARGRMYSVMGDVERWFQRPLLNNNTSLLDALAREKLREPHGNRVTITRRIDPAKKTFRLIYIPLDELRGGAVEKFNVLIRPGDTIFIGNEYQALQPKPQSAAPPTTASAPSTTGPTTREAAAPADEFVIPEINFNHVPMSDVLEFLSDISKTRIVVDWPTLDRAGLRKDAQVTLRLTNLTLGEAIDAVFDSAADGKFQISRVTGSNAIQISTPETLEDFVRQRAEAVEPPAQGEFALEDVPRPGVYSFGVPPRKITLKQALVGAGMTYKSGDPDHAIVRHRAGNPVVSETFGMAALFAENPYDPTLKPGDLITIPSLRSAPASSPATTRAAAPTQPR